MPILVSSRKRVSLAFLWLSALAPLGALAEEPDDAQQTEPAARSSEESGALCVESHREGQRLERDGQLLAAQGAYRQCLRPACSPVLREECDARLRSVEADTPSIIVAVQHGGEDLVDGVVYDGDNPLDGALSGVAVPIDPGPHRLRFTAPGFEPGAQSIVARVGEKNRLIVLAVEPKTEERDPKALAPTRPETTAPPKNEAKTSEGPRAGTDSAWGPIEYGLFSSGAVLGVGGVVLSVWALTDFRRAREECSPHCSDRRMNGILIKSRAADALFALSAACVVTGSVRLILATKAQKSAALVMTPQSLAIEGHF